MRTVKQGSKSLEAFNALFRINGGRAQLEFRDPTQVTPNAHQGILKHLYAQALSPKLAAQIIIAGEPATINAWMVKGAEIASAYRRTNTLFAKGAKQGHGKSKKSWKPRYQGRSRANDYGEPMDIDAVGIQQNRRHVNGKQRAQMSPQQKEHRAMQGLCFNC